MFYDWVEHVQANGNIDRWCSSIGPILGEAVFFLSQAELYTVALITLIGASRCLLSKFLPASVVDGEAHFYWLASFNVWRFVQSLARRCPPE